MESYDLHDVVNLIDKSQPAKILISDLLKSDIPNIVQTRVVNAVEKEFDAIVTNKSRKLKHTVNTKLSTAEENYLLENYPEFDIKFTSQSFESHGVAAICRDLSNELLLSRAGYDLSGNNPHSLKIKDVGGNYLRSFMKNRSVHSCCPVLDAYDSQRSVCRSQVLLNFMKNKNSIDSTSWKDFIDMKAVIEGSSNTSNYLCTNKFQNCSHFADVVIAQDSVYDISGSDFAEGMVRSKSVIAYISLIFDPMVLTKQCGKIEGLNCYYRYRGKHAETFDLGNIDGTNPKASYSNPIKFNNDTSFIEFGFENDSGFVYLHDTKLYLSWFLNSVISFKQHRFIVEMLENRGGYQFLRVSPLFNPNVRVPDHRIWFKHHNDKYLINVFDFSYKLLNSGISLAPKFKGMLQDVSSSCTYRVPLLVDKEMVDRARDFASTVTSKFTPDEILMFLKSLNTSRPQGNVINRFRGELNSYELRCVALAVYITVFDEKWRMGKINKQMLNDIADMRELLTASVWTKLCRYLFGDGGNQLNGREDTVMAKVMSNPLKSWLDRKLYSKLFNHTIAFDLITTPPSFLRVVGGTVKKVEMYSIKNSMVYDPDDYMFKGFSNILSDIVNNNSNFDITANVKTLTHADFPVRERVLTPEESTDCNLLWATRDVFSTLTTRYVPECDCVVITKYGCELDFSPGCDYKIFCEDKPCYPNVQNLNDSINRPFFCDSIPPLLRILLKDNSRYFYVDMVSLVGWDSSNILDDTRLAYRWLKTFVNTVCPSTLQLRVVFRSPLEFILLTDVLSNYGKLSDVHYDDTVGVLNPTLFVTATYLGKRPTNLYDTFDELIKDHSTLTKSVLYNRYSGSKLVVNGDNSVINKQIDKIEPYHEDSARFESYVDDAWELHEGDNISGIMCISEVAESVHPSSDIEYAVDALEVLQPPPPPLSTSSVYSFSDSKLVINFDEDKIEDEIIIPPPLVFRDPHTDPSDVDSVDTPLTFSVSSSLADLSFDPVYLDLQITVESKDGPRSVTRNKSDIKISVINGVRSVTRIGGLLDLKPGFDNRLNRGTIESSIFDQQNAKLPSLPTSSKLDQELPSPPTSSNLNVPLDSLCAPNSILDSTLSVKPSVCDVVNLEATTTLSLDSPKFYDSLDSLYVANSQYDSDSVTSTDSKPQRSILKGVLLSVMDTYDICKDRINKILGDGNCCIRSATEGKFLNLKTIKDQLSLEDPDDKDLQEECRMGVFGGTTLLSAFARHAFTDVIIRNEDDNITYKISAYEYPTKSVTVKYSNLHYDHILPLCIGRTPIEVRLHYVRPVDPQIFLEDGFVRSDDIKIFDNIIDGKIFFNNLKIHCGRHVECSNFHLNYIFSILKLSETGVLRMIVEKKNVLLKSLSKIKFSVKHIQLPEHIILEITLKSRVSRCNNLVINHEDVGETNIVKRKPDSFNVTLSRDVDIKKYLQDSIFPYTYGYDKLTIYSKDIRVGKYYRETFPNKIVDYNYIGDINNFDYIPEKNENSRIINSMIEIRNLWQNAVADVVKNIRPYFDVATKTFDSNYNFKDVSFGLIDLVNRNWIIKPKLVYEDYKNCYANEVLECDIQVSSKGELKILEMQETPSRYVAVSRDTRLVVGNKLFQSVAVYSNDDIRLPDDIVIVEGAPGVGKTSWILNNHDHKHLKQIVVTTTREGATDLRERAKQMFGTSDPKLLRLKYRTGDSLVINYHKDKDNYSTVDTLWIDEGFMKHCGEWFWYAHLTRAKRIVVLGDSAQIPFIDRSGRDLKYCYFLKSTPNCQVKNLSISYRCPLDIVCWLNNRSIGTKYPFQIRGTSDVVRSVNVVNIVGLPSIQNEKDVMYLTFNQEEKVELVKWLRDPSRVSTVHEYQGKQHDKIVLVRLLSKPYPVFESPEHILVALTRHRKSFVYYTVKSNDMMSDVIKQVRNYSEAVVNKVKYSGLKGGYVANNGLKWIPETATDDPYLKIVHTIVSDFGECTYVPWRWVPYDDKCVEYHQPITMPCWYDNPPCLNILQDFVDYFLPGGTVVDTKYDQYLLAINKFEEHSRFLRLRQSYITTPEIPVHYVLPNLRTTVKEAVITTQLEITKAFFERNGNVPQLDVTVDRVRVVSDMIDKFKRAYIDADKLDLFDRYKENPITVNKSSVQEWLFTQHEDVRKNLEKVLSDADTFHCRFDFNRYDYILKRIPKIEMEPGVETKNKSPQTIAFQSKDVNAIFCPVVREIKRRLIAILKSNVLIFTDMSTDDLEHELNCRFSKSNYFKSSNFTEIDFSKYDKSQGLLALEFEITILSMLGLDPILIEYWIFMHVESILLNRNVSFMATTHYQRKSGDAMTFLGNTLFLMGVLAYSFDLTTSDKFMMFSGDDSLIFSQNSMKPNMNLFPDIFNLEAKILKYDVPYFCSKFLIFDGYHWFFIPDPLKLVIKLGRKDLKNFVHVDAYYESFVDIIKPFRNISMYDILSYGLSQRYNVSNCDFSNVYQCLIFLAENKDSFRALYYLNPDEEPFMGNTLVSLDI